MSLPVYFSRWVWNKNSASCRSEEHSFCVQPELAVPMMGPSRCASYISCDVSVGEGHTVTRSRARGEHSPAHCGCASGTATMPTPPPHKHVHMLCRVSYMHLAEHRGHFSIGIFLFRDGADLPLHDHVRMSVYSRCARFPFYCVTPPSGM